MLTRKKVLCLMLTIVMAFMLLPTPQTIAAPADPNAPVCSVTLIKEDSVTGAKLNGAIFRLWRITQGGYEEIFVNSTSANVYESSSTATGVALTTGTDGKLKVSKLPPGDYYFEEITAPEGYTLPTGAAAQTHFNVGNGVFTATANRNAYGSVYFVLPFYSRNSATYGPRLGDLILLKYLKDNGAPVSASATYISSFARYADGFLYNNCIDFYMKGHAYTFLHDDLMPQVRWLLSKSPAANTPIEDLSEIVDWYYANVGGLTEADFNLDAFHARYDDEAKMFAALSPMNKNSETTSQQILDNVGLEDFDQFLELVVIQMAFSAAVWHFTNGFEIYLDADSGWQDGGVPIISIPPAVEKIYNWYMTQYAGDPTADTFSNETELFSLVRIDDGSDPLHHMFKFSSNPASADWHDATFLLSDIIGGVSFNTLPDPYEVTINKNDDIVHVYLDAPDLPYTLVFHQLVLKNVWYARETDSAYAGVPSAATQDHLLAIRDRYALLNSSTDAEVTVRNAATPVTPYVPPVVPPQESPEPSPDPSPEQSPEQSPEPSPEPRTEPSPRPYVPGGNDPGGPPTPHNPGTVLVPDDDGGYIEFDDDGTPLGRWYYDDITEEWIFDEFPPLGALSPPTGDSADTALYLLMLGISLAAICSIAAYNRKKKQGTN